LEDNYEDIRVLPSASRIQLPRIDANRLSQRQPQAVAELARQPVWTVIPSRHQSVSETTFDSEYAALRATLLSLARDGYRLIGRITEDNLEVDSRAVRGFLQQIDRFDELAADHRIEPVRSWAHHLKCRVLDAVAIHV
jgi:hypothetical protein